MSSTNLKAFTDRDHIVEIFNLLRVRTPSVPEPLLPILTIIGPTGSGKRTLIEYLRVTQCCHPIDGHALQPYAYLDFKNPVAPRSILSILVAFRNQLQRCGNGLTFPRFDLGALLALISPSEVDSLLNDDSDVLHQKILCKINEGMSIVDAIGTMNKELGEVVPFIGLIIAGLKLALKIPQLQDLLLRLNRGRALKWYQTNSNDIGLQASTDMKEVLERLFALSRPENPERTEILVEDLLPRAFIEDVHKAS
jgi:hypothetical protein